MDGRYKDMNLVFFDLETKRGAAQVGWSRIANMGMSLAVTYSETYGYETFLDSQVESLIRHLKSADAVVGFNHVEFDYRVLSAYTDENLTLLKNIDMFLFIFCRTRRRISLDKLAQGSLRRGKTGDGLDAIEWYKQGRLDLIEEYCREDVAITRDLYYLGCEKGYVSYLNQGKVVDVAIDWGYSPDRFPTPDPVCQDSLEMDVLQTFCKLGKEFAMYDTMVKIAQRHGLFRETNDPEALSISEKILFKDIQKAARGLARAKCVEQTSPGSGLWRFTPEGVNRLREME